MDVGSGPTRRHREKRGNAARGKGGGQGKKRENDRGREFQSLDSNLRPPPGTPASGYLGFGYFANQAVLSCLPCH